jgi:FRG domain
MPHNDIRPQTWAELQEVLFKDTWDARLGRFRSPFVYRGVRSAAFTLATSLQRLGGPYATLEHHLLRNFRKYAVSGTATAEGFAAPSASVWNWLALAQHHGLPTRLLDWTYSPYVALHFATDDLAAYDQDGVIWAINYIRATDLLPPRLREAIRTEGSNVFTPELMQPVCSGLRELEMMQQHPFVLFLEPPSLDARIVHQHALFSLMSTADATLQTWLEAHPELCYRVIVPAHLKWEVRDKLDQANITERVLFPGLGGLSRWLHRHYTPATVRPSSLLPDEPGAEDGAPPRSV